MLNFVVCSIISVYHSFHGFDITVVFTCFLLILSGSVSYIFRLMPTEQCSTKKLKVNKCQPYLGLWHKEMLC